MKNEGSGERRLAAILAADVVGYSKMMGADEVGTLRALKALLKELIEPSIAARHGRIVKTTGDGLLAEFPSAVEAVACAITIQRDVASRSAHLAEEGRLVFRIGINVGDIIIEQGDIFGDGVNVAARLEHLSEPGGICISRAVRDQVRDKLPVAFEDLGEQAVKNIARKVRAFALSPQAIEAVSDLPDAGSSAPHPTRRAVLEGNRLRIIAALAAIVIAIGIGAWWLGHELLQPASEIELARGERASIAVLPFTSRSEAGDDDYFADGLTEDIISALGHFRELSVVSRGGVFAYKGQSPTPAEVGRDLNVRYVVEGSVRRSLDSVRVSVSLTDTSDAVLLWSDRYDGELADIFSVQDQISRAVSGALAVRVTDLEIAQSTAKPPSSLEAYDLVLRGRASLALLTRSGNAEARALFEQAIALDPNYAPGHVGLGRVNLSAVRQGWTADPRRALERAEALARKAIELDDLSPGAHALLGSVYVHFGDYDRGVAELRRAIDLNSSDAEGYSGLLNVLLWSGDTIGAIEAGSLLAQFQPNLTATESFHLATAFVLANRSAEASALLEEALERNRSNVYTYVMLSVAYADLGRDEDANRLADEVRRRFPGFSADEFGSLLRNSDQRQHLASLVEQAGFTGN